MNATTDVLIVGAGPTGLALACDLLRRGVRARCIDQLAEPVVYSKAAVVRFGARSECIYVLRPDGYVG